MRLHRSGQRIVAGVRGSVASQGALRWAAREAALRGSALHVVRAWEDERRQAAPYARVRLPSRRDSHRRLSSQLEELVQAVVGDLPGVEVMAEVVEGLPARVLIERAAGAELLVVGSAAGGGPDALGPVARSCLTCAPCPVVVVSLKSASVLAAV